MRRLLGQRMSDREKAEKRELLIKMTATGEPGASVVATVIIEAVQKVVPGDMSSVVAAAAKISTATHQWIEDPEAYTESVRSDFTADRIGDRIVSATGLMEEAMGGRSESTDTPE
ncbi:hypothetical protein C1N74_05435 [Microbacterium sp. SGAir0570]|nr:hypothetical protein C1N74_05435 [Microbacterium sp. SGAir0570]